MNSLKKYHPNIIYLVPDIDSKPTKVSFSWLFFTGSKMLLAYALAVPIITLLIVSITAVILLKDVRLEQVTNSTEISDDKIENLFSLIGLLDSVINNSTMLKVCNKYIESPYFNFSYISHTLSIIIMIVCLILVSIPKPKLPIILTSFKKENRLYTALVYGLIATDIFKTIADGITSTFINTSTYSLLSLIPGGDPSGLLKLIIQIIQIFIASLRHLPILFAFNSDSFLIYVLSAFYCLIDFGVYVFRTGKSYFIFV